MLAIPTKLKLGSMLLSGTVQSSMKIKITISTIYSFPSKPSASLKLHMHQYALSGKFFSTDLMLIAGLHCLFISAQTTLQILLCDPIVAQGLKCHGHWCIQAIVLYSFFNSFGNDSVCQEQIISLMAFGGTYLDMLNYLNNAVV